MNIIDPDTTCNDMVNATISKIYNNKQLDKNFGHCVFKSLRCTAQIHNLTMFGNAEVFEDCSISKKKKNSINKVWLGSINIPGERIYIDISSISKRSLGSAKF
jgi:hypothetical protein